jgi:hypothetical protein
MKKSAFKSAGVRVCSYASIFATALLTITLSASVRADIITQIGGTTKNFAVLYTGGGGNQLMLSQGTINGAVGIAGTGTMKNNGSGAINGNIYFSALDTGQYSGNKTVNGSIYYGDSSISQDLSYVSSFSSTVGVESGTAVSITGSTTINAASGTLDGHGNRVFNLTALTLPTGSTLTINGDLAGDNVILNMNGTALIQGNILLIGILPDQVLFNITNGDLKIQDGTVAGDFVDINGSIFVSAETLNGRVFGGDSSTMQIVSDDTITRPSAAPEPVTLVLSGTMLLGLLPLLRRKLRRVPAPQPRQAEDE